jgi:23S rRNA (adenine2503-C2)-methyltransferase
MTGKPRGGGPRGGGRPPDGIPRGGRPAGAGSRSGQSCNASLGHGPRGGKPEGDTRPSDRRPGSKSRADRPPGGRLERPTPAAVSPSPGAQTSLGTQTGVSQPLTLQTLLALYRPDLAETLATMDAPTYRYTQVFEHLLLRPDEPFAQATPLPTDTRMALDTLGASTLTLIASRAATDGTTKLLLTGRDGVLVETVLMPYRDRLTVCLSSQVGCPVGCAFCATGTLGFQRNLTVAEIVDQVRMASALAGQGGIAQSGAGQANRRLSNLVYMGMGEPLLNLQAVLDSIRVLTDSHGLNLAHRAISVSTIGIPNGILRLARTEPQVNLALSLHAADDRTRALLVPEKFRHPLADILAAAWEHFTITHRKLLVEYVLIRGINDSVDAARRLAGLLHGHVVTVNLLAWNPALRSPGAMPLPAGISLAAPARAAVVAFRDALTKGGIEAVIRHSKGTGIEAACGQLAARAASYRSTG